MRRAKRNGTSRYNASEFKAKERKASSSDQQQPRPYQGVRVKEPVKELLKRKRGNLNYTNVTTTTAVVLPSLPLSTYSAIGQPSFVETDGAAVSVPIVEDGTLCTSWIPQPSSAALQPLTQWASCPDYIPHESAVSCPYTTDMYVQPVCPSYTVVGYTSQPVLTNFGPRNSTPAVIPQFELTDQQGSFTYFPWAQPISALPAPTLQCQTSSSTLPGPQFVPTPITIPDPVPQDLQQARQSVGSLPIEKLLQEDEDNDTYVLSSTLSVEGF
ncbi:POU domain class 2-associating factor 1 [Latimeria chalumnae]|uniref:POU domain class 2-associating factor 1 n=1 Tax=Latimeria chalumnae TaxID=7897 RepID=UPI00313C7DF6